MFRMVNTPTQEDGSMGEANLPLTKDWIKHHISERTLSAIGLAGKDSKLSWSEIRMNLDEIDPERTKGIVNPMHYESEEVSEGKSFYLGKKLSSMERTKYVIVLREFSDVFAWTPSDLEGILQELGEHHIELVDRSVPVQQRQYRLNPKYSLMIKVKIDRLLKAGFIYPVHNSEWVSPIMVILKKVGADGKVKIRVCHDFKKLNAATKKDYFPLPFTELILDHVSGHKCYNFLNGFSGFNQAHIRNQDQLKTTFTTEWDTFAFNRMPFGLCSAPRTFQRLLMDIFQDFLRHFLEVFIGDFTVFSLRKDHLEYLENTFQRCRKTCLKLHPDKCFFGMTLGVLLRHVVSERGLEVDIEKVKTILSLVAPSNVREIRGFLRCVGYYWRFMDEYAQKAIPLIELLKKDVEFNWNPERQKAFEDLKLALVKAPILSPRDWEKEFHVTLDESRWYLGVILW